MDLETNLKAHFQRVEAQLNPLGKEQKKVVKKTRTNQRKRQSLRKEEKKMI